MTTLASEISRSSTNRLRQTSRLGFVAALIFFTSGCATIRVTDPARTATEQFLESEACRLCIAQLSADVLRDRKVFIDSSYLTASRDTPAEDLFMLGELRAKLLTTGVRLVERRDKAQIVLEVRSAGIGVDHREFLLGIPATYLGGGTAGASNSVAAGQVPISIPELSIVKTTTQKGYASVAFIAYWVDTGEVVASSGPFVGRTVREDYWFFGTGPRTVGNIPPAEK